MFSEVANSSPELHTLQPAPITPPEIVHDLLERLASLALNGNRDNPDRPPICSYVETSEPNGVRFVATAEYRRWFHRTYGGSVDEVPAPKASPVAQAQGAGAGGDRMKHLRTP